MQEVPNGRPYCYEYPRPAVTVDVAAFAMFGADLRVLLIRRKKDPFAGRWALPGGFLDIDEPIEAAARRELREETGVVAEGPLRPIGVFGDPGRDPRGRTISLAHATFIRNAPAEVHGADDAAEAAWRDPRDCRGLAFDHDAILRSAISWFVAEALCGAREILPEEFGEAEVGAVLAAAEVPNRSAADWLAEWLNKGRLEPVTPGADRYRFVTRPG